MKEKVSKIILTVEALPARDRARVATVMRDELWLAVLVHKGYVNDIHPKGVYALERLEKHLERYKRV